MSNEAIRGRLEKAKEDPGLSPHDGLLAALLVDHYRPEVAELLAHAPEDIGHLLKEVDRLKNLLFERVCLHHYSEIDEWKEPGCFFCKEVGGYETLIENIGGQLAQARAQVYAFEDFEINATWPKLVVRGVEVPITFIEYKLILQLAGNPGKVFTKDMLLKSVWGEHYNQDGSSSLLKTYIYRIRKKIEINPHLPQYIMTGSPSTESYYFKESSRDSGGTSNE